MMDGETLEQLPKEVGMSSLDAFEARLDGTLNNVV